MARIFRQSRNAIVLPLLLSAHLGSVGCSTRASIVKVPSMPVAQDVPKPAPKPSKHAIDQYEVDLIKAVVAASDDPAAKLVVILKWVTEFPRTYYSDERLMELLNVYQRLRKPREATATALEILKTQPNSIRAYQAILTATYEFEPPNNAPTVGDLQTAERATHQFLDHFDEVFALENRPGGADVIAWVQAKPKMKAFTQRTLGYIAMTAKDNSKAESELIKTLRMDSTQAVVSLWLATVLLDQRREFPQKQELAIFEYARVAVFDGPGALDATARGNAREKFDSLYEQYHGSMRDAGKILALAKTNALPPARWKGINPMR